MGVFADLAARCGAALKAFRIGPAAVGYADTTWGFGPEVYQPTGYADMQSASAAVYACTQARALGLAGLPLALTKGRGKDVRPVEAGALVDLLDDPNPFWDWSFLVMLTEIALCTYGEAFLPLERGKSGKGTPTEIWWADPSRMRVVPDPVGYLKGFIYDDQGVNLTFAPDEVIWIRLPNVHNLWRGLSPLGAARLSVEMEIAAKQANRRIFSRGYQIAGVVTPADKDQHWTQAQLDEVEQRLSRRLAGGDKAHSLGVFAQALNVQPLSLSPKDAEFIEMMRWSLADVCRVYRVPPIIVQDLEKATYSNMDQAYKAMWTDCLVPEANIIAAALTKQLLPMFGGQADRLTFDMTGVAVLQEDRSEIVTQMAALWAMGVPLNRLLSEYQPNLMPEDGNGYPWGDEPAGVTSPAAPAPAPKPEDPPKDETPAEAARRALAMVREIRATQAATTKAIAFGSAEHAAKFKALNERAAGHEAEMRAAVVALFEAQRDAILARLGEASAKGVEGKGWLTDILGAARDWWGEFIAAATPIMGRAAVDAGLATLVDIGVEDDAISFTIERPEVRDFLAERAQRFAEQVNETTWERLKVEMNAGRAAGDDLDGLAARVEEVMGDRIRSSAEVIARTETLGALNGGALEAARASGVVKSKAWLGALDDRIRATHVTAHARYQASPIPLDEDFQVGEGRGPHPGAIGLPEEDIQCRCSMTWVVDTGDGETRQAPAHALTAIRRWLDLAPTR